MRREKSSGTARDSLPLVLVLPFSPREKLDRRESTSSRQTLGVASTFGPVEFASSRYRSATLTDVVRKKSSGTAESRTRVQRTPCAEDTTTPRSHAFRGRTVVLLISSFPGDLILPAVTIRNRSAGIRAPQTHCRRTAGTNLHIITAGSIRRAPARVPRPDPSLRRGRRRAFPDRPQHRPAYSRPAATPPPRRRGRAR